MRPVKLKHRPLSIGMLSILGALASSPLAHAQTKAWTTEDLLKSKPTSIPYSEMADYLNHSSSGLLQAKPQGLGEDLHFRVNAFEQSLEATTVQEADWMDAHFTFDESGFIKSMNQPDFLQAKIAYYKNLAFDGKSQTYERKYIYPNDWKDLFFPPVHELTLPDQSYDQRWVDRASLPKDSAYYSSEWHKSVDAKTGTRLTFGNKLELLENGLSLQKKIELAKKATQSIYAGVMTFTCDPNSDQLVDVLIDRAKAGVDVRVVMEGLWTEIGYKKCAKKMRKGGIDLVLTNDMVKIFKPQILFHNKIWIFDNNEAIMGGQNIIDSDGASTGYNHMNRDVDIHVEGPAVTDIMQGYAGFWDHFVDTKHKKKKHRNLDNLRAAIAKRLSDETAAKQRGQENYDQLLGDESTRNKGVCRFGIQGPQGDRYLVSKLYAEYIGRAEQSLYLTSPDISFQEGDYKKVEGETLIWNAVQNRAKAGVLVDVITTGIDSEEGELGSKLRGLADKYQTNGHPGIADFVRKWSMKLSRGEAREDRHFLEALAVNPTLRPWSFFQYYHGKTILMDRRVMAVGSFNLEDYSSNHSHESTIICQDDDLVKQQDREILRDLVNSVPVFIESGVGKNASGGLTIPQQSPGVQDQSSAGEGEKQASGTDSDSQVDSSDDEE